MRKNMTHASALLTLLLLGSVYGFSLSSTQTVQALPRSTYYSELIYYSNELALAINGWNNSRITLHSDICSLTIFCGVEGTFSKTMNATMLHLNTIFLDLKQENLTLPYNQFSMDILMLKYDKMLNDSITLENYFASLGYYTSLLQLENGALPATQFETLQIDVNAVMFDTIVVKNDVLGIGTLIMKAKLEFLERPILNCFPRIVAVAKSISCHGSNYPPNMLTKATFQDSQGRNTTAQMNSATGGSMTANSFFDVFFDVFAPSTVGTYHLILEQSGQPSVNSFFDVFVALSVSPTILEPSTIIPLTVLIAAVATLAVASVRVRRPT